MRALASGGVQPNLNLSLVRGIPVPVASEPTRRRLLDIQLALDDAAQRLRLELRGVVSRGRSLRRALLAAAFSGRLTGRGSDTNVIEKLAEEESA
jgi:type I restriction enzyme S subunit